MKHVLKKLTFSLDLRGFLLICFLFTLFFPIRHTFLGAEAYKIGQFSDFTSFSIYLSDIFLIILAIFVFLPRGGRLSPRGITFYHVVRPIFPLFLWVTLVLLAQNSHYNLYFWVKWVELFVAYGTMRVLFQESSIKALFYNTFVSFASIQAVIAIWQFLNQGFIGLNRLGEQPISPYIPGFAKIIVNSETFVRGYGTFPHPNLLGAFFCVAVLILIYLLQKEARRLHKIAYVMALGLNIFGLIATFSRASIIATILGAGLYFIGLMVKKLFTPYAKLAASAFMISLLASVILFWPFLATRATVSDNASMERIFYSKVGLQILKHHPLTGVGLGESVLHMQQYSPVRLDPWQIQPVHNYFLLAATELGIVGVFILVWIFWFHLKSLVKTANQSSGNSELTTYYLLLATILICFLLLMQFDHYFYTLQQTQILLWVVLGIIAAEIKTPSPKSGEG